MKSIIVSLSISMLAIPLFSWWTPTFAQGQGCVGGRAICGEWVEVPSCSYPVGSACDGGLWPAGLHATHAVLVQGSGPPYPELGKLLLWRVTDQADPVPPNPTQKTSNVVHYWDPRPQGIADPTMKLPPTPTDMDVFCAGHAVLPDGRVLLMGGADRAFEPDSLRPAGIDLSFIFDPQQPALGLQQISETMAYPRFYPTATILPDGRVLCSSGQIDAATGLADALEMFDPVTNDWSLVGETPVRDFETFYPFMHVTPTSPTTIILHSGPRDLTRYALDLDGGVPTWTFVGSNTIFGWAMSMYGVGRILESGGPTGIPGSLSASEKAEVTTVSGTGTVSVNEMTPMEVRRSQHNLVALPNGEVYAFGGTLEHRFGDSRTEFGVYATETFFPPPDPQQGLGAWFECAQMTHRPTPIPRMYHSIAVLLPDGRVLVAGGDAEDDCPQPPGAGVPTQEPCISADFFYPPYLFKPGGPDDSPITDTDRPQIQAYSEYVGTGAPFVVTVDPGPGSANVIRACLIRPAATTHGNDMDQRVVPLTFDPLPGDDLLVGGPTNLHEAPPGDYVLFFMNDAHTQGHPSIAKFVNVWGIMEPTVNHAVAQECKPGVGGNPNLTFTVSWNTTLKSTGVDSLVLYSPGGTCGNPTGLVATDTPVSGGSFSHQVSMTVACQTGSWKYIAKSSMEGSSSAAVCRTVFVSCVTCSECPPSGCEIE